MSAWKQKKFWRVVGGGGIFWRKCTKFERLMEKIRKRMMHSGITVLRQLRQFEVPATNCYKCINLTFFVPHWNFQFLITVPKLIFEHQFRLWSQIIWLAAKYCVLNKTGKFNAIKQVSWNSSLWWITLLTDYFPTVVVKRRKKAAM